jgi:hypothetical protein
MFVGSMLVRFHDSRNHALTNGASARCPLPVLQAGIEAAGLSPQSPVRDYLRNVLRRVSNPQSSSAKKVKAGGRKVSVADSSASNQSDWAQFAILRSDWSVDGDTLAIAHHQPLPAIDLFARGEPLLHGTWGLDVQVGDAQLELAEEWPCACWSSDPDSDYLELQMAGPKSLYLERFAMLSRAEHYAVFADCLRGTKNAVSECVSKLPLATGITAMVIPGTREVQLKNETGKVVARVYPLAMPVSGLEGTPHSVAATETEIVFRYRSVGQGQFSPIVIDWHPERRKTPAVWRQLTVSELGKRVPPDLAAGFRCRTGSLHLLVFRSLKKGRGARAVLGYHTHHETAICNVNKKGEMEPVLIVD